MENKKQNQNSNKKSQQAQSVNKAPSSCEPKKDEESKTNVQRNCK